MFDSLWPRLKNSKPHTNGMNHEHMGGKHTGHQSSCSMNMLFTWDTTDLCVVFEWWHVKTLVGLVLTIFAIIALSAGYEWLRYRIRLLDNETIANMGLHTSAQTNRRIKQAIGYAFQVTYSYFLMLIFMSYNGLAMLSVAVGAGIGFWIWGDKAQRTMSCH